MLVLLLKIQSLFQQQFQVQLQLAQLISTLQFKLVQVAQPMLIVASIQVQQNQHLSHELQQLIIHLLLVQHKQAIQIVVLQVLLLLILQLQLIIRLQIFQVIIVLLIKIKIHTMQLVQRLHEQLMKIILLVVLPQKIQFKRQFLQVAHLVEHLAI